MNPSSFLIFIFLLCTVITSLHCVPAIEASLDHVHNVIEKDEHIKNPTEEHTKTSTLENPLKETKITIKNNDKHEKKLTIRHPLPPSWHDILPHEAPRYNKFDQDKVHQEFLLHEGPKLQRRLHHHFTIEELRQRRKELRERLQARYNKLTQMTSTTEAVLKMTPSPSTLPNSTHAVVRKTLETTTLQPTITTTTTESNEINAGIQLKIPTTTPEFTTPTLIAITTPQTEVPFVGLAPRMRKILDHVETTTENIVATTRPNLLSLLREKHRFSALKNLEETTASTPDVTTLTSKPTYRSRVPQLLGVRRNVPTSTEMVTTTQDDVVPKRISVSNAVKKPLFRFRSVVTTEIPEITTVPDVESGKNEDWRQHLREAIKRRLQKFRRQNEE